MIRRFRGPNVPSPARPRSPGQGLRPRPAWSRRASAGRAAIPPLRSSALPSPSSGSGSVFITHSAARALETQSRTLHQPREIADRHRMVITVGMVGLGEIGGPGKHIGGSRRRMAGQRTIARLASSMGEIALGSRARDGHPAFSTRAISAITRGRSGGNTCSNISTETARSKVASRNGRSRALACVSELVAAVEMRARPRELIEPEVDAGDAAAHVSRPQRSVRPSRFPDRARTDRARAPPGPAPHGSAAPSCSGRSADQGTSARPGRGSPSRSAMTISGAGVSKRE